MVRWQWSQEISGTERVSVVMAAPGGWCGRPGGPRGRGVIGSDGWAGGGRRPGGGARRVRRLTLTGWGRAGVKPRSWSEQPTTNTLDRLMAAAATIGLRRPRAARGMAATL